MLTGKSEKPQLIFAPRENKVNPAPKKGTIIPLMDRWPSISRSTLLRGLIPALILGVWAALMAWLIRTEAFPEFFDTRSPGYRGLAHSGTLLVDRWMAFQDFLRDPIAWHDITQGLLVNGVYAVVFWLAAWARFAGKDVTS